MSDIVAPQRLDTAEPATRTHPRFFEAAALLLIAPLCVVGAIIGVQLIVTLGITANTSLIGALAAMGLARVPFRAFARYRSIHVQNLAQSAISAATFGAGNSLMLPIGIPFVLGRADLILPMLAGVFLAMLIDAMMLYRMFDSEVFPASGAWPPGAAAAEAIRAGDEGGRKAAILGVGVAVGVLGNWLAAVPMSAFGVAFIGNIWALTMFGVGLLVRGYSGLLFNHPAFAGIFPGGDINKAYVPHGMMVGAGVVALIQVGIIIMRRHAVVPEGTAGPSGAAVRRTLGLGVLAYLVVAVIIAASGGLAAGLTTPMLIGFILYAAFAALVHELIVGLSAMHSGWFPAFAVALITLVIGMLIGFPPVALALLVGFSAATGPAFADMGYDLKAGFMLRGNGADPAFEHDGRRQQLFAAMFALVVAGIVVYLSYEGYFARNLVAPVARVYVATIKAGASASVAWSLLIWAIPGAVLQFVGGPRRQIGVLFATGLLILSPVAGWAVIAGILCRIVWERLPGKGGAESMQIFGAGVIAGDALFGFFSSVWKNFAARA
ncbi:MAG TPA: OPT/YSL family transporter [Acetobacteraceae bacterium]|nr:OPT/YSL family transporter [Acetobacteraceae bacterium]